MKTSPARFAACLLCALFPHLGVAQTPDVGILVHGIHFGGEVIYRYQVWNRSAASIDAVELGLVKQGKELPGEPWVSQGLTDVLAPVSEHLCKPFVLMTCTAGVFQFDYMQQPKAVVRMEDSELRMEPPPAVFSNAADIRPGSLSSVAELRVPRRNSGYLAGWGSLRFGGKYPKDARGQSIIQFEVPFTRADTTPPSLAGSAATVRRGGLVDVNVALSVTDNLDPNPAVTLVSVTSNERLRAKDVLALSGADSRTLQLKRNRGRVYFLNYRAVDGSENTSNLTITVPGD